MMMMVVVMVVEDGNSILHMCLIDNHLLVLN